MAMWLTDGELGSLEAVLDCVLPGDGTSPSAAEAGGVDYIDRLLGAFTFDPPRIFAGGPLEENFGDWIELGPLEELAWRMRIEGSLGRPEREFNGPVTGWQEVYRDGLAALGDDYAQLDRASQVAALDARPELRALAFEHACESLYGDPGYGGNRREAGWGAIAFDGQTQPRGWTDTEVSNPSGVTRG